MGRGGALYPSIHRWEGRHVVETEAAMDADRLVRAESPEAMARHVIEFDPRASDQYTFAAPPGTAEAASLAAALKPDPIPWPVGLAPAPTLSSSAPSADQPLPPADVLVVTYTVAEGYAVADVLTPGRPTSHWTDYRHKWAEIKKTVKEGAPSLHVDRAARWTRTKVGDTTAVVVKSEMHPATDGIHLPIRALWRQMIAEVRPR